MSSVVRSKPYQLCETHTDMCFVFRQNILFSQTNRIQAINYDYSNLPISDRLDRNNDIYSQEKHSLRSILRYSIRLFTVLSDHLDHIEYAVKIGPILRKLAPVMSEREFRSVWCLQKGRYYRFYRFIGKGIIARRYSRNQPPSSEHCRAYRRAGTVSNYVQQVTVASQIDTSGSQCHQFCYCFYSQCGFRRSRIHWQN